MIFKNFPYSTKSRGNLIGGTISLEPEDGAGEDKLDNRPGAERNRD